MPIVSRKNFSWHQHLILGLGEQLQLACRNISEHFWVTNDTGIVFLGPITLRNKIKSMRMRFLCPVLAWPPLTAHCNIYTQTHTNRHTQTHTYLHRHTGTHINTPPTDTPPHTHTPTHWKSALLSHIESNSRHCYDVWLADCQAGW